MTQFQGPNPTKLFGARRLLDGNLLCQGPPDHSMAPKNLLGGNQTRETRGTPLKIDVTSWKIMHFPSGDTSLFIWLVVEPTHLKKYARQTGSFPQFSGVKNKKYFKPPTSYVYIYIYLWSTPGFLWQMKVSKDFLLEMYIFLVVTIASWVKGCFFHPKSSAIIAEDATW